jgi:DNA end-binding protein Ku
MWRGAIQFGLVTIPVRLYLATEPRGGLSFNLLHEEDLRRIQMKIHCPEHGEIPRSETVRGFEWSKGQYVVLEESDFEAVPLKTVRSIEIEQFVPAERESREAVFVKQSYYLEPEPVGLKAFSLLRTVLSQSGLQAVCKIVLKDREQLAALDPFGPTMLLSTLYWPDEVRALDDLELPSEEPDFKKAELEMARQLVDALSGEFDPSRYHDEYREALLQVIAAKADGMPVEAPEPVAETGKLADLMAVLEASVAAARAQAGGEREGSRGRSTKSADEDEPVSVAAARRSRDGTSARASSTGKTAKGKAADKRETDGKATGRSTRSTSAASSRTRSTGSTSAGETPARRRKSA